MPWFVSPRTIPLKKIISIDNLEARFSFLIALSVINESHYF